MAGEPVISVAGNLASDPDLRFTANGVAVVGFTVASTPRSFDKASGEYVDGETLWVRCTAFKQMAENIAESLNKGNRVVVTGQLRQENWTTKEGEKRTGYKLMVDECGPSLKFATAAPEKVERTAGSPAARTQPTKRARPQPQDDPWAGSDDDPPF